MLNRLREGCPVPTITVSDATFDLLTRKAAAAGVSPSEFISLSLSAAATPATPAPPQRPLQGEAWWEAFEAFSREVQSRAHLYPPGFELDVSREAMYPDGERE